MPRVSVGMPVYNGENYVEAALTSLLAQTFTDFEVVVTDNASTDRTVEIVERFAAEDDRVKLHRSDVNVGAAPNFNRCLELSTGEWFRWHAHDDTVEPGYLEAVMALIDDDPSLVAAHSGMDFIDERGVSVEPYEIEIAYRDPDPVERVRSIVLDWHLCGHIFGVFRRDLMLKYGGLGSFGHSDGVLLERIAMEGPIGTADGVLWHNRKHAEQSMARFGVFGGGSPDYQAYVEWFDESRRGKLGFAHWRMVREHWTSVVTGPLSARQKLGAARVMVRRTLRLVRPMVLDLQLAARTLLRR
ncbi:MAG: glycosyltransferase family 2 protein [Actinomycetota bacterium]